jgi:hypothetical protein
MDSGSFDALTRRASLLTLGAAGLAGVAVPMVGLAKKKKKKKKGDVNKFCKQQVSDCQTFVTVQCAGNPDCLDALPCCDPLATCDFGGWLNCLIAAEMA